MLQQTVREIIEEIQKRDTRQRPFLIAIDGRCASGKTTLAAALQEQIDCNVIHMDHFFLRPDQRTPQRLAEPGGNVDRERFAQEVLCPLMAGQSFSYRPFDCHSWSLIAPIEVAAKHITVVEGSYSCHPALRDSYDLRIFLTVDPAVQLERIEARGGADAVTAFRTRWIPMEETYFAACGTAEHADIVCVAEHEF